MRIISYLGLLILATFLFSCDWLKSDGDNPTDPGDPDAAAYQNVSSSNLPLGALSGNSMDAQPVDIDFDGDIDLVIAVEFGANRLLLNNGNGFFSDASQNRIPARNFDSEDVAIANFNADNFLDLFFASEDNEVNEFYLNQGSAFFTDAIGRIPVTGMSNAAEAIDVNGDGAIDILIGNNGINRLLINNGNAFFSDQSGQRLPNVNDITQDIEFGDLDGDGDLDIVVANEDANRILINTGNGFFADQTSTRLPLFGTEETREVDLGDLDGDGDLDIYFSNVTLFQSGSNSQDRLLINNGQGVFSDSTSSSLPQITTNTVDADFFDIDADGDLDILAGNFNGGARVFINDGSGNFADDTENWLPQNFFPRVVDFEVADYNGDGLPDIYVANFQSADALLIRRNQ